MMKRRWIPLALVAVVLAAVAAGWSALGSMAAPPAATPHGPVDVPASWRAVRDSRGHKLHVVYGGVPCRGCHGDEGFTTPAADVCTRCHKVETPLHDDHPLGLSPPPVCVDCHHFADDASLSRACMGCHQSTQGFAIGAVGIHAPRDLGKPAGSGLFDELGSPPRRASATASPHGDLPAGDLAVARRDPECSSCHHAHRRPTLEPQPCASCHPQAGDVRHAGLVGGGCTTCHSVHEREQAAADACASCHAQPATGKHREAHVDPSRALFAGHDTCTGCHRPHRFDRAGVAACRECHDQLPLLAEAAGGRTQGHRCASCHNQHDPRAVRTCVGCHTGGTNHRGVRTARSGTTSATPASGPMTAASAAPAHAAGSPKGAAACTGCHPVHDPRLASANAARPILASLVRPAAIACASCHPAVVSHAPTAACITCHPPHGAAAPLGAALCATCHADRVAGTAGSGHANCLGCHVQPGHAAKRTPPRCESCHTPVAQLVNRGHADCQQCHKDANHAPRAARVACATCHTAEAGSAPKGHQECVRCHAPHDGKLRPTAASCTSCHTDRTRGHGAPGASGASGAARPASAAFALTFQGTLECKSCHRPHGPGGVAKPPACDQCHTPAALPGLHRRNVLHRRDCANCHFAHEPTGRGDRATCLACHQDRRTHEPTAPRCSACHPFAL